MAVFWAKYHIAKFKAEKPEQAAGANIYVVNYIKLVTNQKSIKKLPFIKQINTVEEFEHLFDNRGNTNQKVEE